MPYSYRIHTTITDVNLDDWNKVLRMGESNVFMDPRFTLTVERALSAQSSFRHLIFYDEQGEPVSCTSLCTFNVDLFMMAPQRFRDYLNYGRRLFPWPAALKVAMCGLPVSSGQSHLVFAPGADRARVLQMLDHILTDLAQSEGARFIIYKEFTLHSCGQLESLQNFGYRRADSPSTHYFTGHFKDFDAYCASLRSHYRNDIRRSEKKFRRAGLSHAHLRTAELIERTYTPEVHRLYEAVVERAEIKLEVLPINFFLELVRQFPDQISLTVIYKGERVVAFNWGLFADGIFRYLFCGLDYSLNEEADLYFNLMYRELDYALRCRGGMIIIGQMADHFKSRLGCEQRTLHFYIRGVGRIASLSLRLGFNLLFPKWPAASRHNIFRRTAQPLRADHEPNEENAAAD